MKARNEQWAELLEVRLDRIAAIQVGLSIDMPIAALADDSNAFTRMMQARPPQRLPRPSESTQTPTSFSQRDHCPRKGWDEVDWK